MKRLQLSRLSALAWLLAALALLALPGQIRGQEINQATSTQIVHIFFSGGCVDCWPYLEETLLPVLETVNPAADAEVHDFTRPGGRTDLLAISDAAGLPRSMADSLYAFIPLGDGQLASMGHVPRPLLQQTLSLSERPAGLVIWQPQMHGEPVEYRLWAFAGQPQTFPIDTPLAQALSQIDITGRITPVNSLAGANLAAMLPAVVISALIDSVNPCAFAAILLSTPTALVWPGDGGARRGDVALDYLIPLNHSRQSVNERAYIYGNNR